MRRAQIGDVYYVKLPNGYKIFQWAYRIPKLGDYIRVFDGLYQSIPNNIAEIVDGSHSYIIGFFASRAYRIGLAKLVDNYPVPNKYPFPNCGLLFWMNQKGEIFSISLFPYTKELTGSLAMFSFDVSSINDLPVEYRNLKLLHNTLSPDLLFYLFDYDFDLSKPKMLWPYYYLGNEWESKIQFYTDMVETAVQKEKDAKKTHSSTSKCAKTGDGSKPLKKSKTGDGSPS